MRQLNIFLYFLLGRILGLKKLERHNMAMLRGVIDKFENFLNKVNNIRGTYN